MSSEQPFEQPVIDLQKKIADLRAFATERDLDLSREIEKMEQRLAVLEEDVYENLQPWDRVQIARHHHRPTTLDYVAELFDSFLEMHGDRLFGDDQAIVGGIALYKGQPVTVIGHQRGKDTKENIRRFFGSPHPEGYRKALRLMKQAEKFGRPIICLIDTKGAYPGKSAEERGQSEAIARNLLEMAGLHVPTISIVIGEGGSGGALALGVADRIYMLENATYSVISPEGAAALLWKDATQARRAAETMRITAPDLFDLGIIDAIIPEPRGGAQKDIVKQAKAIADVLDTSLAELQEKQVETLLNERYDKFKKMGEIAQKVSTIATK
ncbi:acetyl-CoA carboxylase carboxyltransferase subunit alpha [Bacillus sp. FSL W7-1360]